MKNRGQHDNKLPVFLSVVVKLLIFIFLGLCMQTVYAQSKCEKKKAGSMLICDLSISLIEQDTMGEATVERAWYTTAEQRDLIRDQLELFSEHWCDVTLGKSRIRKISILTGNNKSSADVALYNNIGRSYAYVGAFAELYPSIVLYYAGFNNADTIDPYLGKVLVHEFAHDALKIYDEYREYGVNSSPDCLNPLSSDNPRSTIMNNHTIYTRFSHPVDYADTPPAQTAQYRCYGKSAWEVLRQPERCDSNLSLRINSWFPRQDYFSVKPACTPKTPSINQLENPRNKRIVNKCLNKTRNKLNINFLSGSENIFLFVDSGIDEGNKVTISKAINRTLDGFAVAAGIEDLIEKKTRDEKQIEEVPETQGVKEKRVLIADFNDDRISDPGDIRQSIDTQKQKLGELLKNPPQERKGIDTPLNAMKEYISTSRYTDNDHNVAIIISDTPSEPSTSAIDSFKDFNIPVHTIRIGKLINPGLSMLSSETGGSHFTVAAQDEWLDEIVEQVLDTNTDSELGSFIVEDEKPESIELSVPQGSLAVRFHLYWDDNNELGDITFIKPDDSVANSSDTLTYMADSYAWSAIIEPEDGVWNIVVTGNGAFDYEVTYISSVDASIHAGADILPRATEKAAIVYPAPIPVRVRIHGHIPIINAKVTMELRTPNGNPGIVEMPLLDNGKSPDSSVGDGIYSGLIKDYSEYGDGIYTIRATLSNLDGSATFDDSGIATFGTTRSEVLHKAPKFHKVLYYQVEVIGTRALPNTNYNNPRDIGNNGALNWGVVEGNGHTNWYRFKADSGRLHYIQTSNLLSHGDTEMATNVGLYEPNPSGGEPSFLTAGVGHRGTNVSHIEYTMVKGNDYLISVSHANNDSGVYALTVNDEHNLLSSHEINRAENSDGSAISSSGGGSGGGGGGGSVDYLMLVLMLIVLAALVLRQLRIEHRHRLYR